MKTFLTTIAAGLILATANTTAMAGTIAALYSTENQVVDKANAQITLKLTGDANSAFKLDGSKVVMQRGGFYTVNAVAQAGGTGTGEVYLWLRVNGKDVAHSNAMLTIATPKFSGTLLTLAGMELKKNDSLEVLVSATAPGLGVISVKPPSMPEIPSITLGLLEF